MKHWHDSTVMNMYEHALEYADRGWSVIPLREKSKRPAIEWKKYQEERATKEELKRWFQHTRNNIALVTGKISGVTVVDLDNEDAKEWYWFNCEPTETYVDTSRGLHGYHKYAPFGNRANNGVDVRGDGGIVALPPSIHPTGVDYMWDQEGEMTQFDPRWFEQPRKQLKSIMNTGLNYDVAVAACINYVRKIDPAISGSGGHSSCFRCACKIADFVGSFLSIEDAMPILRDWNENNQPPFSEQELLHKMRDAYHIKGYGS